jgi:uncharacterized membrane protein YjjB (DUF3815 family)
MAPTSDPAPSLSSASLTATDAYLAMYYFVRSYGSGEASATVASLCCSTLWGRWTTRMVQTG